MFLIQFEEIEEEIYSPSHIAAACLSISRLIAQEVQWTNADEAIVNLKESDFRDCYNVVRTSAIDLLAAVKQMQTEIQFQSVH